jgi:hypothetical protein
LLFDDWFSIASAAYPAIRAWAIGSAQYGLFNPAKAGKTFSQSTKGSIHL